MIGKLLGGRYEVLEQIGGGGMAKVYKAKCRLLNRYVAIKVLKDEFANDEDFVKKFRRESQAAASLSHPNIVNIYDVGTDNEDKVIHYIVMEYIDGLTLKEKIERDGRLSFNDSVNYSKQIASALRDAHKNNIIHRDIKSQNIMIDQDNRVKVMDFGIARAATSSTITTTSDALGSVHYFSPEQARGGYTDEKSDIYSLGIVMYEMVTGELPYKGESPITIALKHVQEEIVSPSIINIGLNPELEKIILKAVEKRQVDRYMNIDAMLIDLDKLDVYEGLEEDLKAADLEEDFQTKIIPIEEVKDRLEPEKEIMDKNKKKDRSGLKMTMLGILTAFLFTSLIFFGKNKLTGLFSSKEVLMPNLIDMTERDAIDLIEKNKLDYRVNRVVDASVSPGTVIGQDPIADTKLKEGYPVEITISDKGEPVPVPNLINRDIYEAESLLRRLKLKIDTSYENSDLPAGKIISQDIPEGTRLEIGSIVAVRVSQGEEMKDVTMPKLTGVELKDATDLIESSNLKLGSVAEEDSELPKGTIIWQNHKTGDMLKKNSVINLKISNGKKSELTEEPKEDEKNKEKPVSFTINVAKDGTSLRVERTQAGITTTVYNEIVDSGDVPINTSGQDGAKFDIYADGALIETINR